MLWAAVSSVVPMVRVTQVMHQAVAPPFVSIMRVLQRVTVRPVCAVGDATGGGGAGEGLPVVQPVMVSLLMSMVRVLQVMDRVTVLLVMPMAGEGVAGDGAVGDVAGGAVAGDVMGGGDANVADGEGVACAVSGCEGFG